MVGVVLDQKRNKYGYMGTVVKLDEGVGR